MSQSQAHKTILQRKLSNGTRSQLAPSKRSGQWSQAVVGAAQDSIGLNLTMGRRHVLRSKPQDLHLILNDIVMIVWCDDAALQSAFVAFDAAFISAMIEVQTIGRVQGRASEKRAPSQTDFALIAPCIERILARASGDNLVHSGLRPRRLVATCNDLLLSLGHCETSLCVMSFRLGNTELSGKMVVGTPRNLETQNSTAPKQTLMDLCPQLDTLSAEMSVVIHRFTTTLSYLHGLKVGDRLVIPQDALIKASLVSGREGPNFTVELGKSGARRAVRLVLGQPQYNLMLDDLMTVQDLAPSLPQTEDFDLDGDLEELLDQDWLEVMDEHEKTALPTGTGG